ncbi:hypothetical protein AvCA_37630 [Azotobacter vinelandii CA]|uniref:Uncharacterized protein n=2 Tax=Azotobacter vinelandii TaxID=354 RepID=C1DS32_AZOVD|nr:hypothetical protein [Azotobacter vinelandii]ACO79907.1 hypothetical protein Avin_37630 [Azotobacter vinelandii DJ]AGK14545.1 hypothetical protein AvCA_37630 [Azotobacter vinelandii CA]AGK21584.1 hypothetical protein AvCA6_37630 [Azotobacter vinelandii CA6]SFX44962.1 hypothetical protein SAMN04244547_01621 [Azotobacter vinelandii]GLK62283.1 hypothetical protein GCM10017624_44470 [Azotobacter vinelandii]
MKPEIVNRASDVYGIGRELPLNYVTRNEVDEFFVANLTRDRHVIIYGSSKQGKTSLRKHCLKDEDYIVVHCSNKWGIAELNSAILKRAGYEVTQSSTRTTAGRNKIVASFKASVFGVGAETGGDKEETNTTSVTSAPLELDPEDVNDIISALKGFKKFIVLEDFHYLPIDTQKDFSVALKAFHEQSSLCFIIVGVWLEEGRLTVYNGDLTGRIIGVNADRWTHEELHEVISAGEAMLNICFAQSFKDTVIANSLDSVYIVQEACYQACTREGINLTQSSTRVDVGSTIDVPTLIREVVNQQTGRYNSFITLFAGGFQETALQMYKWLLYPVLSADNQLLESGLTYRHIRDVLRQHHPEGQALNIGNLTQALQSTASLQVKKEIKPIVLDYDQTNLKLNVVDRGFLIWLANQNRADLLELADLPTQA